jgi:predicted component of type VI protein secretion system
MFNEMRAGARVEMEARPREADTPTILALKVAGGEQVLFSEEAIIKIGSLDSCHLVLDHPSVSRMHAVIEFNGRGVATLIDLGSASGTRVNDAPINKVNLEHGDLLGFGNLSVKVSVLAKDPRPSDSGRGCVECRTPMVRQYLQGVEVDVCPAHGAWFDAKELQTILHRLTE